MFKWPCVVKKFENDQNFKTAKNLETDEHIENLETDEHIENLETDEHIEKIDTVKIFQNFESIIYDNSHRLHVRFPGHRDRSDIIIFYCLGF